MYRVNVILGSVKLLRHSSWNIGNATVVGVFLNRKYNCFLFSFISQTRSIDPCLPMNLPSNMFNNKLNKLCQRETCHLNTCQCNDCYIYRDEMEIERNYTKMLNIDWYNRIFHDMKKRVLTEREWEVKSRENYVKEQTKQNHQYE